MLLSFGTVQKIESRTFTYTERTNIPYQRRLCGFLHSHSLGRSFLCSFIRSFVRLTRLGAIEGKLNQPISFSFFSLCFHLCYTPRISVSVSPCVPYPSHVDFNFSPFRFHILDCSVHVPLVSFLHCGRYTQKRVHLCYWNIGHSFVDTPFNRATKKRKKPYHLPHHHPRHRNFVILLLSSSCVHCSYKSHHHTFSHTQARAHTQRRRKLTNQVYSCY